MKQPQTRTARNGDLDLNKPINQELFASMIGSSQQEVSKLLRFHVLTAGGTLGDWTREYTRFQMGQIFARTGWAGLAESFWG